MKGREGKGREGRKKGKEGKGRKGKELDASPSAPGPSW